jgi:hypothetical protein
MTRRLLPLGVLLAVAPLAAAADVVAVKYDDRVEFRAGGDLVTVYRYAGTVPVEKGAGMKPLAKPYFYPLNAPGGVGTTRPWPIARGNPGETTDHFHQKSAWFCHGDVIPEGVELKTRSADRHVKGIDFWAETAGHGRIVCVGVEEPRTADGAAVVVTRNEWRTPDGVPILAETRTIRVRELPAGRLVTLLVDLEATVCPVTFGDTKEGSMGVRVSDEYRLNGPGSKGAVTSSEGATAKAPAKDNLPVWGRPADWNDYGGTVGGTPVGLAVFDHPANPHRANWHTRAYGLMAANPFGRGESGFPAVKGRTDLVRLAKGGHLRLTYGLYAHAGDTSTGKVTDAFQSFVGR